MESEIIKGTIELKTGLHIGGMTSMKIGGVDSPVIKDPFDFPYIPGSSFKGKLRSLCSSQINTDLFGAEQKSSESKMGSLIFRDCFVNLDKSKETLRISPNLTESEIKSFLFETKAENSINRETGTAASPRFIERVKKGVVFDFEVVISTGTKETLETHKEELLSLFDKLSKTNYLGGSGTRGYGYIDIQVE